MIGLQGNASFFKEILYVTAISRLAQNYDDESSVDWRSLLNSPGGRKRRNSPAMQRNEDCTCGGFRKPALSTK